MKAILYQLTTPFSYLRIEHDEKYIYDWIIPLCMTIVSLSLMKFFIPLDEIVKAGGLIDQVTSFIGNLPGFFIAALAAVATFSRNDIDELIVDRPRIKVLYQGQLTMVDMTRRRFLCVLFSYLTAVSIFLVIITRFALAVQLSEEYFVYASCVGVGLYTFVLWQMIIATVLGLYYLGERLHTPQQ
ncbi:MULTISPECIES: hypothetical protein [Vibrio]|uniref:hypothetical protein n=1 Tax=Vibrio TaxID=662 RepID=UPI000C839EBE|nr:MULTISPECIES: hypothetical protein [Vibrio]PMI76098.1 hypothetical protein BCU38_07925 [Vibrio splendidus]